MTVNVQIQAKDNEDPMGVLRRFRNRIKSSGLVNRARSLRYSSRAESKFTVKKGRLRSIDRAKRREKLYKMGKISER